MFDVYSRFIGVRCFLHCQTRHRAGSGIGSRVPIGIGYGNAVVKEYIMGWAEAKQVTVEDDIQKS